MRIRSQIGVTVIFFSVLSLRNQFSLNINLTHSHLIFMDSFFHVEVARNHMMLLVRNLIDGATFCASNRGARTSSI